MKTKTFVLPALHCEMLSFTRHTSTRLLPHFLKTAFFILFFITIFGANTDSYGQCVCRSSTSTWEWISNVVVTGGISNATGKSNYTDYSGSISTVQQGQSISATLTFGGGISADNVYVFADWNNDNDFVDAGEAVGSQTSAGSGCVINFTVPLSASITTVRLRIKYGDPYGSPAIDNTPCQNTYEYGETEDYRLNITSACSPPTSITTSVTPASSCTSPQSVTFNVSGFSGGNLNGGSWDYQWQNGGTVLQSWSATSSYTASLSSSVTYTVYMRSTACPASISAGFNASFTLNAIPAQPGVISGPTAPCVGASVNYFVTNVAGVTYTWVFPAGWVQTGGGTTNSVTVTIGANPGTVQVTPSNTCGSGTPQTLSVNPGAGPIVTVNPNPASACGGVGVLLTASGSTTYSWAPATGLSATTGTSVTANPASTTTYTITETGSGCNNSASVQVRVGPSVSATASVAPASVCPGGLVNLTSTATQSQQTLFSENFESANSLTLVNGTQTNKWFRGTSSKCNGSYALFISNNSSAYQYTNTSTSVVFAYFDVTIPAGATSVQLSYNYKSNGESGYDDLKVFSCINSTSPAAGTTLTTGANIVQVGSYQGVNSCASSGIIDLSAFAGQTRRIIFQWRNDYSDGSNGPGLIDDILVNATLPGAFNFSWSSAPAGYGSALQNPTANPNVATSYTVIVTQTTSGCSASATTAQVTMIPAPAQPVISGPASVCSGTAGVVYSVAAVPNATSYTWSVAATGSIITSGQGTTSITITFGSTTGNITCYTSNACGVNSTSATYSVTALAAPAAPTVTGATSCGPGSVILTASGGVSYNWYNVPTGGSSLGTGSTYTTPVISIPTTYYVAANNGSCDGPRTPVVAGVYNGGLDNYSVTRTPAITYSTIAGTNPTWKNGTDADNNLSNPISLPFDFPFDGGIQKQVLIGVDGLITFNTATNADGADIAACGTPEPYTWQNSNFTLNGKLGSLQAIAPFYNDLYCNTSLAASISYTTTGTTPSRIFKVQWQNMSNDEWCSEDGCSAIDGNLNFQLWLHETSGNIEFYYGSTQTQTTFFCTDGTCDINDVDDDYTAGLNSSTLSSSPTASQLLTQQTANTATFNNTPQNGLTTLPAINSKITFTRTAPSAPTQIPSSICAVKDNYPANAAITQCLNQILSWSPGDGNPTNYKVYFGTNPSPPFVANTTHTYYNPGPLSMFTTYYWKIVPENGFGAATNITTWSFTTGQGDVQPTEILSTVGTLVSHVPNGTNSLGQQVWTNTYDICENQWNGTLTAVGAILSEGSALDWTNPIYFWGFPIVQCTEALPTEFWGNCAGFTQTPIITIGGWFSSMFNGGTLIYDVFTRGCNNNGACTRIIINLNPVNEAPDGIDASANPLCTGGSTTLTQDNGTLSPGAQYVWYQGGCGSGAPIGFGESITVSPTVTTTYYVRVEGGNACASTTGCEPFTVTVNQLPVIPASATANYTSFCAGAYPTINLSATGGSGTTLNWSTSCGGAVIGTGTTLAIAAPASSTTYYASWTTSCGTSACVSVPITVTASGTPTFAQAGPYCSGAGIGALPTTSINGYNGSWSPAINNTATTLYTFTPTIGQCAANTTMTITVNPNVNPSFTALGPYCVGAGAGALLGTSLNGVTGTWSPATISTAGAGTTTYNFTPTGGQCATTASMPVTVNANATPSFSVLGPYCVGAGAGALLGTSLNGVTGTWSPATISTAGAGTTTYNFTPTGGQCATTASMPVTVNANASPSFTALGPYCEGAAPGALSGTSLNGVTGTWSPASISTAGAGTTTYNFTPTGGQCATTASMPVAVNANVTPSFSALGPYCVGAGAGALLGTSLNGVTGTWSPATISTAGAGTTTYNFTPTGGQCATTASMPVTVNANVTPSFSALGPYCVGAGAGALLGTSLNGVSGTWSPASISTAGAGTTTYNFTPTGGQCATTASMPVTVNANINPSFTTLGPYCVGAGAGALLGTSLNGVTGTWSPASISTGSAGTTTYNFTPSGGQCATTASMAVTVGDNISPSFTALGPYCVGEAPGGLSGTSINGITGSWSPASIGTGSAGTTTYNFTPSGGQCANTTSMPVTVNANVSPSFTALGPYCQGAAPGALLGTSVNGITGSWSPANISTASAGTTTYNFTPSGGQCATATTMNVAVTSNVTAVISGGTSPICDKTSPGTFTVTASGGSGGYVYQWYNAQGAISGATTSTYTPGIMISSNAFYCSVTSSPCGWIYSDTTIIMVIPQVGNPTPIALSAGTDPVCQLTNGTTTTSYTTTATNNNGFIWSLSNPLAGTIDPATGVMTWADGFYGNVDIQVVATGCGVPSPMIAHPVSVSQTPTAEAGTQGTYTGIPVPLGNISSGPGTFSWSPATGLNNPAIAQPLASPGITTTYTLTVNNNGCIATDTVTINFGGTGHIISGKTLYAGKANAGNPVPNIPTYNPIIYAINNVIVILRNFPANDEVARDTSDASGVYQFTNVMDGAYTLSYDKYTADSMMWGNDVNAIDVALMKYFIGSDTLQDPTRSFAWKYKKAANVDNNTSINAVDVARIKAKIGAPYDVIRNFPRGNWVAMNKQVAVAGSDLIVDLETICYGDYNASSSKYRDSTNLWSGAKSLPSDIIVISEEVMTTNDPSYFEIPLRISSKVNDFSALGLELNYLNSEFNLVSAYMPGTKAKGAVKINPTMEEIMTTDNDLLVTDQNGTIRVVYATTNHFDVVPNDEMLILGFRVLKDLPKGEIEFTLTGTGVIGNQFGEENEDTYLMMPKVFVQGNTDAGFEFSGYPNPFNGEASITYNLPENGMVTLSVFNAIGELLVKLVNEKQERGKHSVLFSEKNLAAGMYTFKLEFDGLDNTKCLVLKMIR